MLCEGDALVDHLKVNQAWAVGSWGALCWVCPGKLSGAEVVEAYSAPVGFGPVSLWQDDWSCSER